MLFKTGHTLFRPPAEAGSLILRVADGCPWNGCSFCGMYKGVRYHFRGLAFEKDLRDAARQHPDAGRIFLADGDVMHLDFHTLEQILTRLNQAFKHLVRVSLYANGTSILAKHPDELRRLRELKLHTLYMGLESGDPETLRAVNKRESADEMVEAGCRAQAAGLRMSVMILTGLAGKTGSLQHARATAQAVNRMKPRLLSALRLILTPNTPLYKNGFQMMTEQESMEELREMISGFDLCQTVFRADHSSNSFPLEGRFPKDRERVLTQIDTLLSSGLLDRSSPGDTNWRRL